jgi:hypothetical protein
MRLATLVLLTFTSLTACKSDEPPAVPPKPRPPTALIGSWERQAPRALRGDTLTLRADSTANGLILWGEEQEQVVRSTHWYTFFASRDPVSERQDWRRGFTDGGDPECSFGPSQDGCISMPMICIGAIKQKACQSFVYVAPDSLLFHDGSVFLRIKTPPVVALSQ